MCFLIALFTWVLVFFPVAAAEADVEAVASLVSVVGLNELGNPELQGLGVVVGREGQVLTSASLFPANRGGVVKTAAGTLYIVRSLLHCDPLQDLAIVQIEPNGLAPVQVSNTWRPQLLEKVWIPVKGGNGFRLQEAEVSGVFPLSPRLSFLKLNASTPERTPGSPIFNHRGELLGMLHSFSGSTGRLGLQLYLARDKTQLPLKYSGKDHQAGTDNPSGNSDNKKEYLFFWEGVAASIRQTWQEAKEKFSAALNLSGNLPEAYYGRGVARYHLGDLSGAVKDLEEASRLLSGYALAYLWLGKAWEQRGNRQEAKGAYERAIAAAPELSEAWFHLGELAYQEGYLGKAKEYLDKATDDFPQAASRWWYLGNIARTQNQEQKALEAFRRAIDLEPGFFQAHLDGGSLLLNLGRTQEAARLLTQAVSLEPRNPLARYYLGLTHIISWNLKEAWEQYFALQEINPDLATSLAVALERRR
jgi:tetratricopeptide (TPR) repeat protein